MFTLSISTFGLFPTQLGSAAPAAPAAPRPAPPPDDAFATAFDRLPEAGWQRVAAERGTVVSRQSAPGRGTAYRATTELDADPATVYAVLTDPKLSGAWRGRDLETRVVDRDSASDQTVYHRFKSPVPFVKDRDAVLRMVARREDSGAIAIVAKDVAAPTSSSAVRMPDVELRTRIEPLPGGRSRLTQETLMDLGGSVPGGLVDTVAGRQPFETLSRLRAAVRAPEARRAGVAAGVRLEAEAQPPADPTPAR